MTGQQCYHVICRKCYDQMAIPNIQAQYSDDFFLLQAPTLVETYQEPPSANLMTKLIKNGHCGTSLSRLNAYHCTPSSHMIKMGSAYTKQDFNQIFLSISSTLMAWHLSGSKVLSKSTNSSLTNLVFAKPQNAELLKSIFCFKCIRKH